MTVGRKNQEDSPTPEGPSDYVRALANEYRGYERAHIGARLLQVSEELAKQGYTVDKEGALVELGRQSTAEKKAAPRPRKENAAAAPAPERATPKD
ncbi:hypothetical protein ACIRON_02745 [Nocardioides sp. NPDC101246]|uniref:hypothetical protein n=1 Tax=Nocardioides sp. NPDC101246 TaxID=3364336 RepID=UPI003828AAB6